MIFLVLANRPELTRLAATGGLNLLRAVRKPFALPFGISPPHRLARVRSHGTTHLPGTGVDAQNRRIFVLCFDGTGDQFDADVRPYSFIMHFFTEYSLRTRISCSCAQHSRRMMRVNRWSTIRFVHRRAFHSRL